MRKLLYAVLLSLLAHLSYANEVAILAASATSSSADSSDISCLLDAKCNGKWKPASRDSGVDEGIYLQFSEDVSLYSIELDIVDENVDPSMVLYLNGKTTGPDDVVYINGRAKKSVGKIATYIFSGRDEENFQNSLHTDTRSVFIKISKMYTEEARKPTFKALRFYRRSKVGDPKKVVTALVQFRLPKIAKTEVDASSILSPTTAYHPANLFDSRYDFAWSTDGSKVSGIGEKLYLTFSNEVNIAGLLIWNGYQRSTTHFEKNGRVKSLRLVSAQGDSQSVALASNYAAQKVNLTKPLMRVKQLTIEIDDIFNGSSYKDVLISELRFIDDKGNIIQPQAPLPKLVYDKKWDDFIDSSWSTFLHGLRPGEPECGFTCNNKRLRLRSNGSFVLYLDFGSKNDGSVSANVLEGNWAVEQDVLRIFGKRYTTELQSSDYVQAAKSKSVPTAKIFQSNFTFTRYNDLPKAKQESVFQAMIKSRAAVQDAGYGFAWENTCNIASDSKDGQLFASSYQALLTMTRKYIVKINPYYIESSVVTDLFMPSDKVSVCGGC
ncbi:MAG: hypothetical protein WC236_10230 [Gallionellaceae bacterium]|jgi:hypothetical protein